MLDAGADKVSVNSAALARPELIAELAEVFGAQCVVLAIDAKRRDRRSWDGLRRHEWDVARRPRVEGARRSPGRARRPSAGRGRCC